MLIFVEWEGYLVAPVVRANFREQSWPLKQAEIVKVRLVNIKIKNTAQTSNSNVIMRMHLYLHNVRCHQL